jgi:hypothetical protein
MIAKINAAAKIPDTILKLLGKSALLVIAKSPEDRAESVSVPLSESHQKIN